MLIRRHSRRSHPLITLLLVLAALVLGHSPAAAVPPAGGSCSVTGPAPGATVTGPITITGAYSKAYKVQVAFNAGTIFDTRMADPDGDDAGTWTYTLDPSSPRLSGQVEVTVRCFSVDDRYYRWGAPVTVNVDIPTNQPPTVAVTSPGEGTTASGTVPVTVAATDPQGLASVQVRVDWGAWQTATPSGPGAYVYPWPVPSQDKTHAIEARATDTDGNITTTPTTYVKTGAGTSEPPAVLQSDRALWIWEPAAYQLLENPGARTVLGQFMDDTTLSPQRRSTIYLYADRYDGAFALADNPARYRSLILWAHSRGYRVHALLGSSLYMAPMWAYSRYHGKAVQLVETVLNYNLASAPDERFDGVNVDIEPHGLPEWPTKPTVQTQYLDMLASMMGRKEISGQNLNIGPAIPRWLDSNSECSNITWHGKTQNCARHVIDTTDYISLMDYRDVATGPSGIIAHAEDEIGYAASTGKKVMIGIETDQISATGDPEKISFQEEGRTAMESELGQVYAAFAGSPAFLGVAVHHYDAYRKLPTVWAPGGTHWQPAVSDDSAPGAPGDPSAAVFDWQRVDLHWTRSPDDTTVDHYEVHRSATSGFTPSPSTMVSSTPFNWAQDWGLRPATSYHWKVVAVDGSGNRSLASPQVSATTPAGAGLTPLRITSITFADGSSSTSATVKVVNAVTGVPVAGARVLGHWEGAAGNKFSKITGSAGTATAATESLTAPYTVIFVPEKILAPGYYWAYSLDTVHAASWTR
ncbi:Ig-like domain-containing protein [Acrocarpospora catenulata]|uniref:Ig-like domain-containing protein n=1 Tax=Acrocarpospora catenulata TaxID=2836182 RepID=UPI001BDA41F0|nr:Ig-like domain-containing protein [Acrocarpospora catenulata]